MLTLIFLAVCGVAGFTGRSAWWVVPLSLLFVGISAAGLTRANSWRSEVGLEPHDLVSAMAITATLHVVLGLTAFLAARWFARRRNPT